jgi:DNA adenine methylase
MALGAPVVHAALPPLMEFSTGFVVPVTEVTYFDRPEQTASGIIFENYLWDPSAFADVILQVVDYYRNKKDAIIDYRCRAWLQARKLNIRRVYPRLLKYFADGIPDELDDGISSCDAGTLPAVPPPAPPVAPTADVTAAEAAENASEAAAQVDPDLDKLADEILASAGEGKPTKPLRYPGGDWRIKDEILALLVKSGATTLVEVFGGSGVISMYAPRNVFKLVVYNDKDDLITNFFMVLKERPEELAKRIALIPLSRTVFNKYLEMYSSGEINRLDPVERAAAIFFLNRASMWGAIEAFGVEASRSYAREIKRQTSLLTEYAKMWADVTIENKDFRDIIKIYDRVHTVFYCDPPFLSYKSKDRDKYYRFSFTENDMKDLPRLLSSIKGKFVLKLPYDHLEIDFIKEWASRYRIKEVEHTLHFQKVVGGQRSKFKTILIYNYEA